MTVHGLKTAEDEYARVERFVEALLPKDRVLKVLSAEAGEGRFAIRPPAYVVGADVVQAERGVRAGADEHRVLDLDHLQLEAEEYDFVLCVNVLEHVRNPLAVVDSLCPH
ncbi:MAG: methyltransferase domain-containing protein [Actinobacteria bacterium]|nr:methyltransferase domain-containing protein [Actinomycetota bacterium]